MSTNDGDNAGTYCCDTTNIKHHSEFFDNLQVDVIANGENESLFKLKDVCCAIGYSVDNISKASYLISDEYKVKIPIYSVTQKRNVDTWYITEFGIYEFMGRTKSPKAKPFQKWAFGVIKEVRKTGSYNLPATIEQPTNELVTTNNNVDNSELISSMQVQANAILTNMRTEANSIINNIQDEARATRMLIDAHYTTLNKLIDGTLYTNETPTPSPMISPILSSLDDQAMVTTANFAKRIGKKCLNGKLIANMLENSGHTCIKKKASRAFLVADLKEFYRWYPHLFT